MSDKLRCVAIRDSLHRKVKLEAVKRGTTIMDAVEYGLKAWLKADSTPNKKDSLQPA